MGDCRCRESCCLALSLIGLKSPVLLGFNVLLLHCHVLCYSSQPTTVDESVTICVRWGCICAGNVHEEKKLPPCAVGTTREYINVCNQYELTSSVIAVQLFPEGLIIPLKYGEF